MSQMFKKGDKVRISEKLRGNVVYVLSNMYHITHFTNKEATKYRGRTAKIVSIIRHNGFILDIDNGKHVWPTYLLHNANLKILLQDDVFGELSNNELFKVHNPFLVLESGETMNIEDFDDELYNSKECLYINTLSEECEDFIDYYDSKYIYVHNLGFGDEYVYKTVDELKKYYEKSTDQKVIIVYDLVKEDNL